MHLQANNIRIKPKNIIFSKDFKNHLIKTFKNNKIHQTDQVSSEIDVIYSLCTKDYQVKVKNLPFKIYFSLSFVISRICSCPQITNSNEWKISNANLKLINLHSKSVFSFAHLYETERGRGGGVLRLGENVRSSVFEVVLNFLIALRQVVNSSLSVYQSCDKT